MNTQEISLLKQIINDAGKILLNGYKKDLEFQVKADKSLVSDIDRASSTFIYSSLKKHFPNYSLIDEERKNSWVELTNEYCWIVDPLDATREYLEGKDTFSILIGLLKNKKPLFGISYRPAIDEITFALKDKGAYIENANGIKKLESNCSSDLSVLISSTANYDTLEPIIKKISPTKIIKMGGSTKIIEVAKGTANLFICPKNRGMHIWDICAPQIILEESGGKLTNIEGNNIHYQGEDFSNLDGILATNKKVHSLVSAKLSE